MKNLTLDNSFLVVFLFFFALYDYTYYASLRFLFPDSFEFSVFFRIVFLSLFAILYFLKQPSFLKNDFLMFLLFTYISISYIGRILFDVASGITFSIYQPEYYFLLFFSSFIVPFFLVFYLRKINLVSFLLTASKIHICLFLLIYIYFYYLIFFDNEILSNGRIGTDNINPITLSLVGAQGILLALIRIILNHDKKLFSLILFALALPIFIFGASRSVVLFLVYSLFLIGANQLLLRPLLFLIFLTFCILFFFITGFEFDLALIDRFNFNDTTRLALLEYGLDTIDTNPFFGLGVEPSKDLYIHNLFLESFLINGFIFGIVFNLITFCAFVYSSLSLLLKFSELSIFHLFYLGAYFVSFFSGSFHSSGQLLIPLFTILAIDIYAKNKELA